MSAPRAHLAGAGDNSNPTPVQLSHGNLANGEQSQTQPSMLAGAVDDANPKKPAHKGWQRSFRRARGKISNLYADLRKKNAPPPSEPEPRRWLAVPEYKPLDDGQELTNHLSQVGKEEEPSRPFGPERDPNREISDYYRPAWAVYYRVAEKTKEEGNANGRDSAAEHGARNEQRDSGTSQSVPIA
ncbi:hypothetical protein EK21DRAFT_90483 [Setomelanomma holmii]|uniref:Uncharacterized protein n=1 Tax=Setomelanomma holmii TaxID=210430 RepID=A0A9P4LM59_9PLEO|nr:hypothetical protein EK21DRAFT_90483 [Setomelanomma holmii]